MYLGQCQETLKALRVELPPDSLSGCHYIIDLLPWVAPALHLLHHILAELSLVQAQLDFIINDLFCFRQSLIRKPIAFLALIGCRFDCEDGFKWTAPWHSVLMRIIIRQPWLRIRLVDELVRTEVRLTSHQLMLGYLSCSLMIYWFRVIGERFGRWQGLSYYVILKHVQWI